MKVDAVKDGAEQSKALALAIGQMVSGHETAVVMTALDFVLLAIYKTTYEDTMTMKEFAAHFSDSLVMTEKIHDAAVKSDLTQQVNH